MIFILLKIGKPAIASLAGHDPSSERVLPFSIPKVESKNNSKSLSGEGLKKLYHRKIGMSSKYKRRVSVSVSEEKLGSINEGSAHN